MKTEMKQCYAMEDSDLKELLEEFASKYPGIVSEGKCCVYYPCGTCVMRDGELTGRKRDEESSVYEFSFNMKRPWITVKCGLIYANYYGNSIPCENFAHAEWFYKTDVKLLLESVFGPAERELGLTYWWPKFNVSFFDGGTVRSNGNRYRDLAWFGNLADTDSVKEFLLNFKKDKLAAMIAE